MATIKLYNKMMVLVDDEDFEMISKFSWEPKIKKTSIYARTRLRNGWRMLHTFIMDIPYGMQIDHINHNCLDNRKSNLRIVTIKENIRNRRGWGKYKYKGIFYEESRNKWRAQIYADGKIFKSDRYDTQEGAALAYNELAKVYHGKSGYLNSVEEPYISLWPQI